jgi:hypothetical protein
LGARPIPPVSGDSSHERADPADCVQSPVTFGPFETDGDFEIYRNFKPVLDIATFEDSICFSILKIRLRLNVISSPP